MAAPASLAQIAECMQENGLKPGDIFTHVDLTRSGNLTRTKFDRAVKSIPLKPKLSKSEVVELFRYMDKSKNGAVNRKEFCRSINGAMEAIHKVVVADAGPALEPDPDDDTPSPRTAGRSAAAAVGRGGGRRTGAPGGSSRGGSPGGSAIGGAGARRAYTTPGLGPHSSPKRGTSGSASGFHGSAAGVHGSASGFAGSASGFHGSAASVHGSASGFAGSASGFHGSASGAASHGSASAAAAADDAPPGSSAAGAHGVGAHGVGAHGAGAAKPGIGHSTTGGLAHHGAGDADSGRFGHAGSGRFSHHGSRHTDSGFRSAYGATGAASRPDKAEAWDKELELTSDNKHKGRGRLPLVMDSYNWIRKANGPRDRQLRMESASQTLTACEKGGYTLDGERVEIQCVKAMVDGTRLFRSRDAVTPAKGDFDTKWFCWPPGLSLKVAMENAEDEHQAATVSAASAYHACGGFLTGGRHALEESFCVQSTLVQSLQVAEEIAKKERVIAPACARPARNPYGRPWHCHIPEDGVILSPQVEVFRGSTFEGYPFFTAPVRLAAIISVAMPNANDRVRDAPTDVPAYHLDYLALLREKFRAVAAAALEAKATHLVMPDAGCGVYGNNPKDVGRVFGRVIKEDFPNAFAEIALTGSKTFAEAAMAAAGARPYVEDASDDDDGAAAADGPAGAAADDAAEGEETRLLSIFQRFDIDSDGLISREELSTILQSLDEEYWSDENLDILMEQFDVNGDGYFRYEEFSMWIMKGSRSAGEVGKAFRSDIGLTGDAGKIVVDGVTVTS